MKKIIVLLLIVCLSFSLFADAENPKLALVLSGGGARGIAHIAVIQELEKRGIIPDMVLGTSIGSLVGGFYAAGYTGKQIEQVLKENDITSMLMSFNNRGVAPIINPASELETNLFMVNFSENGIGNNNGVINDSEINGFLRSNLAKVANIDNFDDLSIPFRSVGINAADGEMVIFEGGSLFNALRGSMSLPVFFEPVKLDDFTYIMDGGMADNMPVDLALEMGADVVLAVDVNDAFNVNQKTSNKKLDTLTGAFDAFSWMVTITNTKNQYELADYVLIPDVNDYSTLDFNKVEEILQKGRQIVEANTDVFDALEAQFANREGKTYLNYEDRPAGIIAEVSSPLTNEYPQLNAYIGRPLTKEVLDGFEKVLDYIKEEEDLKHLDYVIDGYKIILQPEEYPRSSGIIAAGGLGSLGVISNGYNYPFFAIAPNISLSAQVAMKNQKGLFNFGLAIKDTITMEFRYFKPINGDSFYLLAGFDLNYLNLSFNSIGTVYEHISKNDTGVSLLAGIAYNPKKSFAFTSSVVVDYTHIARIPILEATNNAFSKWRNNIFIYSKNYLKYDQRNIKRSGYNDFSIFANAIIGMSWSFIQGEESKRSPKPDFRYNFHVDFNGAIGTTSRRFVYAGSVSSNRRYPELKSNYVVTKGGILTSDYIFGSMGYKGRVNQTRFFLELSAFAEGFHHYLGAIDDYVNYEPNIWPFSTLDCFAAGPKFSISYETNFGTVYLDTYVPINDKFAFSIMLGLRS